MLSLILPYWDRQEAADRALTRLAETYAGLDFEVVVVDDGNAIPFHIPDVKLNVTVVRLPGKSESKSPVTCWNEGVRAAHGDMIAISCIEVLHTTPVLGAMAEQLRALGPQGYVLAAAWCPEENRWHTHTTVSVPECPEGTGLAFLGLMYRDLYWKAGGWDEDYREGAGYEDRDFIHRMVKAGAQFCIRDDLVVTHPKGGATIQWGVDKFLRNEALFRSKWATPITFVCLKAGKAFGPEYVNILRDMVSRNIPIGYPGRFVCLTDDPSGLDERIETLELPPDLEKWWGKLYLFKRGLFKDGERICFMDLDTLITGSLDELVRYSGDFATLRDFWHPERLGPAVMLWEAGKMSVIWEQWEAEGRPRAPMGDLWWINSLGVKADILQDLHPNMFCSFKGDCHPYPPKGTRVVCFHGQPRPHNCTAEWVGEVWKIGGGGISELECVSNTEAAVVRENVRSALGRGLAVLKEESPRSWGVVIVAGGPSVLNTLSEIRWRAENGHQIMAVNGSAHWLSRNGIVPDFHVLVDARASNVSFVTPPVSKRHFIASQCAPCIFDALEREDVTLFHANTQGIADMLPDGTQLISAGSTVSLVAMGIAFVLGFRSLHLHGFDSSYEDQHHAYPQPGNDNDAVIDATAAGRTFKCAPWMVSQVQQFQTLAMRLAELGCTIVVAGDGLLPHVAKEMSKQVREAA